MSVCIIVTADEYIQAVPASPSIPLCESYPQTVAFWITQEIAEDYNIIGNYSSTYNMTSISKMLDDNEPGLQQTYLCLPKIVSSTDGTDRRCYREGGSDYAGRLPNNGQLDENKANLSSKHLSEECHNNFVQHFGFSSCKTSSRL